MAWLRVAYLDDGAGEDVEVEVARSAAHARSVADAAQRKECEQNQQFLHGCGLYSAVYKF